MTVNWDSIINTVCLTWLATLFLFFLINYNNNSYESYNVKEYFKSKYCYSESYFYENKPKVMAYCGVNYDR